MNIKRIFIKISIMTFILFIFLIGITANADFEYNSINYRKKYTVNFIDSTKLSQSITFTGTSNSDDLFLTDTASELLPYFKDQTENFSDYIDLYDYKLTPDDLNYIYRNLVYCSPRSYYLLNNNGSYQYYVYSDKKENIVYGVTPVYQLDIYDEDMNIITEKIEAIRPEIDENLSFLDSEVDKIESLLTPGMTDIEKLLTMHNYMNINYDYSYEDYSNGSSQGHNTAMLLARDKKGMCLAFSTLFNYIAMRQNIDTGFVLSYATDGYYTSEYHTWNIVNIQPAPGDEKKWYHIDVAWDDTLSRGYGSSRLDYFLLSDEKLRSSHEFISGNYTVYYDKLFVETGNEFDYSPWRSASSPIVISNGKWYFVSYSISDGCSVLYEYKSDSSVRKLYSFTDKWFSSPDSSSSYASSFSGLGFVNGKLYFNGSKNIYSYSINSGKVKTEFTLPAEDNYLIYSCYSDRTSVYYGIKPVGSSWNTPVKAGGAIEVADTSVAVSNIIDGKIYIYLKPSAHSADTDEIQVFVAYDTGLSSWNGNNGQEQQLSFEIGSSLSAKVFVWDCNMRPLAEYSTVQQ